MSDIQAWTLVFVVLTFSLYIYIAYASRVSTTSGFYVAGGGIPAPANGHGGGHSHGHENNIR